MSRIHLTALAFVIAVGACGPTASRPSAELPALDEQFQEALNTGDIDALVALYAEDARILPPNSELMQGHGPIRATFAEMIEGGLKLDLEPIESVVAGDIGYQVGTYTLQGPDGATVDRGKYMEVWRQVDGEWKMINDMWNSDMPAAQGGQP